MMNQQTNKLKAYFTPKNLIILGAFLLPIILTMTVFFSEDDDFVRLGQANYASASSQGQCAAGSRSGDTGAIYGEVSVDDIKYNVRTPSNYNPRIAHPLLMVYAPANSNRSRTEKITDLTHLATQKGFIVAYADHPDLSPTSTIELGHIPGEIAKKWCIDKNRIYLTGHSDGGTVSMALAFMTGTRHIPSAIAPSAAGINYQDLRDRRCPDPISVMVMHSRKDRLFPGFGEQTSGWWAACNECDPIPEKLENGCIAYTGCAQNTKTWYCEGDQPHSKWPGNNKRLLDFLTSETSRNRLP